MSRLDLEFVRAQFPAFQEPALRTQAYFENAGSTFACRYVIWRLHRFYSERKVQPGFSSLASQRGAEETAEARRRMALLLSVDADEVSFGPSTAANVFVLAQAFRQWLKPGEAIVVTNQDQEANSGAWRRLAESGTEVREWRIDPESGSLDPDALAPLLEDGHVRLVCFPHCSNVLGEVNDVAEICRMARRAGAYTCVDGVSYAPHGLPNVGRLGADIYLFSTYKTYGPQQGIMTVHRPLAERLPAQCHRINADTLTAKFTPAGPDHAQIAACTGVADYIDALYHHHVRAGRDVAGRARVVGDMMQAQERPLMAQFLDWVESRPDVRLLGPRDAGRRVPTFSFAVSRPAMEVVRDLSPYGVMVGGGDFDAPRPLAAMGVTPDLGVLRVSFVHYTTSQEVTRLVEAMDEVL